jgi:hypothetical protein
VAASARFSSRFFAPPPPSDKIVIVFVLLSVDVRKRTFAHKKLQELTSDDEKRALRSVQNSVYLFERLSVVFVL